MNLCALIRKPMGRTVAAVLGFGAVLALSASAWKQLGQSPAAAAARQRTFICAETGKPFAYELQAGDVIPVASPHSGRRTGYPAELCNWTADGRVAPEATAVLLNEYLGRKEPTFCPTCGRLVVGHNPPAEAGRQPPPRRSGYRAGAGQADRRRD